jgi:hypothetical protein
VDYTGTIFVNGVLVQSEPVTATEERCGRSVPSPFRHAQSILVADDALESMSMAGQESRRAIIERANRLLKQSKTLRKLSDELITESNDIRSSVVKLAAGSNRKGGRKK